MKKLSVALATFQEEENIDRCLESVKDFADEIVIVDGSSTDKTVEIAKKFNAKIIVTNNPPNFHINKQKALDACSKEWILQLDADEKVSKELAQEIQKILEMSEDEIENYQKNLKNKALFLRHQELLEKRDGHIGSETGSYTAFFFPRKNYFLGRYLLHGGVYPDGVIRLFKKGKARFPMKDVHEQIVVEGKVGWLANSLLHRDSPTFQKYITRWNRYNKFAASHLQKEMKGESVLYKTVVWFHYVLIKPIHWFLLTYIRHKGFMDGWQGFVFSFFSALRFPVSFYYYMTS